MLQAAPAHAAPASLSVRDVRVTEVDGGSSTAVVRVALSRPAARRVTAQYTTLNGSAKYGSDYIRQTGTLVIPRGRQVARIQLSVRGDLLDERNEYFRFRISNPTRASIADRVGRVRILDNDPLPRIIVGDLAIDETDSGAAVARFPVTLSEESGRLVRVAYSVAGGSAAEDTDFSVADSTGVLEFSPGTTRKSVAIVVLGDLAEESDETVHLTLSSPLNASLLDSYAVATIRDNDALSLSIDDVSVIEGETATFTVRLSRATNQAVSFDFATSNGTASSTSDFTASSGTRTIPAGATSTTFTVATTNDVSVEDTETFSATLSKAVNAAIKDGVGTGTITDNDGPTLSVGDRTIVEGNTVLIPVTLSAPLQHDVTFSWSTATGTASAADFSQSSGTSTIKARSLQTTIAVPTKQDTVIEPDEVFYLNISNPKGAGIADAQGAVTIDDNDGPTLTIGDETVDEAGNAYFDVRLSSPAVQPVTFDWATADGTAVAGSDYTAANGNDVSIAVGQSSVRLTVKTLQDTADEPDETFAVNVSDVRNAQLGDGVGQGLILDDDAEPELSIVGPSAEVEEGKDATFTVTLDAASGKTVTVEWATSDGTALAATDYSAASGSLSFAPGERTKSITVRTTQDNVEESDEAFKVTLSNATYATIATAQDTATIADND
ncbi:MAG TPA: Calx-beta domain-containing protein [Nocardioidaceae bacterium]|nr:Calx-beta domain-containing protein [Nocardioidaceae bacterium]